MLKLEISARDLATVQRILRRHIPDRAVLGKEPVASHLLGALRDDFDESDLPFKVDMVDWTTTNPGFRKIIKRDGVLVQNP